MAGHYERKKGCRVVPEHGTLYYELCGNRMRCRLCYRKSQKEGVKARFLRLKLAAIKLKGSMCSNCGYDRYFGALEFHHLDPTKKEYSWNQLRRKGNWKTICAELEKCALLCANCHREVHAKDPVD